MNNVNKNSFKNNLFNTNNIIVSCTDHVPFLLNIYLFMSLNAKFIKTMVW